MEKFSGEVAESYQAELKLTGRVRTRSLTGGKSAVFGATGTATAGYHLRGTKFDEGSGGSQLSEVNFGQRKIDLDRPIFTSHFVDEWEEMVNHYDVRGPISSAMGQALGVLTEQQNFRTLYKGSLTSSGAVDGQGGGNDITNADAGTSAGAFLTSLEAQILFWDNANVPEAGRFCFVRPDLYMKLVDLTDFQSVDLGNGGNGSLKDNMVGRLKGVDIFKTTVMPSDNYTDSNGGDDYTVSGMVNDYDCNMTNVVAVLGTPRALGTVTLKGVKIESKYDMMAGGTIFKASKAFGSGVLRESDCGSIRTA
jgi:hypothetical protein